MSGSKQTTKTEETSPDGKTEGEYLKDIEMCERKIMKAAFDLLKNNYDRYMAVVRGVEDAPGWDILTRLNLHAELISKACLEIIHSDILDAGPETLRAAKKHIMKITDFLRTISGKEYDDIKAEYISGQDPSIGLMYNEELEQLKQSNKLDQDEFKACKKEATSLQLEVHELRKALLCTRDRKWKIIIDARKRIIKQLLEKFNDVHAERKDISEMSGGVSKGEVFQFWPEDRNVAMSVARHDRYNNLPEEISDEKLVEDMTHGVKELLIDYENIYQAFEKYLRQTIESKRTSGMHSRLENSLQKMRACKLGKDADFKLFDARITSE
ncbi:uncharacterized protein LY89DRAFT_673671 [Mollisia scopiformis]|uniref:Uncharacterized protein n=1 Tax=Mollisia scopiformis TaxID=149040 RepID=A0A194WV50_MOLSC|nr:uncharacterized protein LY89DRAFT_673671 [Mollisia scopiformis]KUJ11850.1 hypothetical protein LY89DRAFT_673671 [Mollisia scopiformis]